jgi:hypothetical protein
VFPGEDQCLQAILEKSEPQQDSEDLAGHPHDDSSEPQPSSRDRPGNPHSTVLKFKYSAVDFSFSQASEAGAWLRANLRSRDWQDLKDTCLLPSHLQSPPLMVPPGNPVLDTHGIPWMSQDGRVTSSHAPGKALRASADETKAFYRSAAIPIRFTPAAPAMATEGYMATLHPSAVYSGKAELTEDEEEPKGESVRHGTKPKPPSTFSGLAPCDFLEWVREVEMWFFIDKHKLHERSTQAASYLSGAAANYWRSKQPAVLEWYMRHRPQHYIHEGQPYIPWTAMKKLLANQFSGFSRLQDLVTELNTLRRKPTQTAHDFNTAFSMLIADIASFGSSQALTEPQHILLYVANSNFGISKQTVNPFTKVLVPWASLEEVFNQGLAECDKLRSKAASLSAFNLKSMASLEAGLARRAMASIASKVEAAAAASPQLRLLALQPNSSSFSMDSLLASRQLLASGLHLLNISVAASVCALTLQPLLLLLKRKQVPATVPSAHTVIGWATLMRLALRGRMKKQRQLGGHCLFPLRIFRRASNKQWFALPYLA